MKLIPKAIALSAGITAIMFVMGLPGPHSIVIAPIVSILFLAISEGQ